MAKPIALTKEQIDEYVDEIRAELEKTRMVTGDLTFTKKLTKAGRATLYYTDKAWMKEKYLVYSNEKEIAWHGVVRRGEEPFTYVVEDILLFKQEVSGTTVTTDQKEYEEFLLGLDDDTFNALKYHGHSHVNMGVTPSTTDTSMYESFIRQLGPEQFYIFTINNKKGARTVLIYDMKYNIIFNEGDVDIKVYADDDSFFVFAQKAKDCVVERTYTPSYSYGGSYGSYYSGYYSKPAANNSAGTSGGGVDVPKKSSVSGDITKYRKGKKNPYGYDLYGYDGLYD